MLGHIDDKGVFAESSLVAVSSTLYADKSDPRFKLALENAERWRDRSIPYVVVDASPEEDGPWVKDAHRIRGATVVRSLTSGIATQRQQGIKFAAQHGATKMVGHEPEKTLMSEFADEISESLTTNAVVVIGRTQQALETLPGTQRRTERLAGWVLERTHSLPPDALSGGRGFSIEGAGVLERYPSDLPGMNNWIYLYDTPLLARTEGHSIDGLTVDLLHPRAMREQEEGNVDFDLKRYSQFALQLDYLLGREDTDDSELSRKISAATLKAIRLLQSVEGLREKERIFDGLEAELSDHGYLV